MNEPKLNQNDYQEILSRFRTKFSLINQNQADIEAKAQEFMAIISEDPLITNDLLKLWGEKCKERGNHQLPLLSFANHIIQLSSLSQLDIHNHFWWHIRAVFPQLYMTLNKTLNNEINKIIAIWEEKAIYPHESLEELKFLLKYETLPEIKGGPIETDILFNLITSNNLKIDDKLVEFTKAVDELNQTGENKQREKVLKASADIIEKQNKVHNQHLHCLMEIDKMLDKIQAYKVMNNNFEETNTNNNIAHNPMQI